MRVLIDECLNWRLSRALPGHYCVSVQAMGWSGTQNGALLKLAADDRFDVFLTGDRNLTFQQSMAGLPLSVVVLEAERCGNRQGWPSGPAGRCRRRLRWVLVCLRRLAESAYRVSVRSAFL